MKPSCTNNNDNINRRILQTLLLFDHIPRKSTWKHKYEFYKPEDCVGSCYIGETASLKIRENISRESTIESKHPKDERSKVRGYRNNSGKKKTDLNVCSTINLKDLFKPDLIPKKIKRDLQTARSISDENYGRIIEDKKLQNGECLQPVDPEEQLHFLRAKYCKHESINSIDSFYGDRILLQHLDEDVVQNFMKDIFQSVKQRKDIKNFKRYFHKFEENRSSIATNYRAAIIKAFMDYFYSNLDNRTTLNVHHYPLTYPVFHIRSPVSWHQNLLNGRNFIRHNLFISHAVLIALRNLWFEKFEKLRIIDKLVINSLPLELNELTVVIQKRCDEFKNILLSKWIPTCIKIVTSDEVIDYVNSMEKKQVGKFFNSVYSLMSLQVRRSINNCLETFLQLVSSYNDGNAFSTDYKDFMFTRTPFINIHLRSLETRPFVECCPSLEKVENTLQCLFDKIVNIGKNIPRVEKISFPDVDYTNENLMSVRISENYVQRIIHRALTCCERNFSGPQKYLEFYTPYSYIFEPEMETSLESLMVNQQSSSLIKTYIDKMDQFIKLQQTISMFRREIPLNMINLKCDQFNETMWNRVQGLQKMITGALLDEGTTHDERIMARFEEIAQRSSETPESTKELVELQNFIYNSKLEVSFTSRRELAKSAEYLDFLLCYSEVPENFITINTKLFRWPTHLEHILELAATRISHKIRIVEENLKLKISKFNETLVDRQKQLDVVRKKDPPVLNVTEMKDMVTQLDHFMLMLKEDVKQANDINMEEDLLNVGTTSYHNLFNIISTLEPFNELWHVVLEFHESYDIWCNNPFLNLNATDVGTKVTDMKNSLNRLSKCFYDVPGAKRMVEIVLTKVEKFCVIIPILETICNPGLQERHWEKINTTIGVQIKRTSDTTFFEILNYGINKHINTLQEINTAATEEYALEKSLLKMKDEWNAINIQHENYRDTGMSILTGIDDIQVMLDDYLLRIQTMRGSPYIGALEDDVEAWEDKLILMQDVLDLWLQVQNAWLYLEPLFNTEDIMRQMSEEAERFSEINKIWNDITSFTINNPQILVIIEYPDIENTLQKSLATLEGIKKGLNEYLEKKRLVFPRFFFLSNHELLEILSESKNFSKIHSHLKCFEGISSLDMTENYDILGIISSAGEVVQLNNAISPTEAKGIVERWLDQLEDSMIQSLCDINNKAIRNFSTTPIVQWIYQWPAMVTYSALYINWTADVELSFKNNTLSVCRRKYKNILDELIDQFKSNIIIRHRSTISTLIALMIYFGEVMDDLCKRGTTRSNDVHWIKHLRYYNEEQTTCVRMLRTTLTYGYEYLGNSIRLIITPQTERCFRLMSSCVEQNLFACLLGASETGKTEMCREFAKIVAKPYCMFKCCGRVGYKVISTFLKGCVQMGAWVCFDGIDNMRCEELAVVAEEIRFIQLAIKEKTHRFRFENIEVPLNLSCNITFVFDKTNNFNVRLPDNLRKVFRPILLSRQNHFDIVEKSLKSYGFKESLKITKQILQIHEVLEQLSIHEHHKSTLRTLKKLLKYMQEMKFQSSDKSENVIAQKAILLTYSSKFTNQKLESFNDILETVFEGERIPKDNHDDRLIAEIHQILATKNLLATETFVEKILQIYDRLQMRQNIILLGPSFTGKTKAYQVVFDLFKNSPNTENVRFSLLNPSSVTIDQLYGNLDPQTGEWTDGILTKIYRDYTSSLDSTRKWIVLDGPMNSSWTERLISVLDENKKMCLISGEIMQKPDEVNFIFETDTADFVSPTLLQNCAVVSFDSNTIDWRTIFASYINILKEKLLDEQIDFVQHLVEWLVSATLNFLHEEIKFEIPYGENYTMHQFTKLTSCILKSEEEEFGFSNIWLQSVIMVSIVWSFAAGLPDEDKISFDAFYRNLLVGQNDRFPMPEKLKSMKQTQFPEKKTVFDWICTKQASEIWVPWIQTIEKTMINETEFSSIKTEDIFVETEETANLLYFIRLLLQNQEPILIVGPQGCGKTRTLFHYLHKQSSTKYITNLINLSGHVDVNRVQNKVMAKTDRRRKGVHGPPMGMKIMLALDDFETLTDQETEGDNNIIELMRQLLEYRYWYDLENFSRIDLIDFIFAGTCKKTGKNGTLPPRFTHHVNLIYARSFNETAISTIFTRMLDIHFHNKNFIPQIQTLSKGLVSATLEVFNQAKSLLTLCKKVPDYFIDIRDLQRVFTGISLMNGHMCQGVDELFRLWVHEIMRVFGDKLSNDDERECILDVIKTASCHYLRQRTEQYTSHLIPDNRNTVNVQDLRKLSFTNLYTNANNDYDEVTDMEMLTNQISKLAEDYDEQNKKLFPSAIFQFVVECICIVVRALQKDKRHILMLGLPGSGCRTILRLAASVLKLELTEVQVSSFCGTESWRDYLKEVLWKSGANKTSVLLVLPGDRINENDMLDDINTLLNTADLLDIYTSEERSNILSKMMEIAHEEDLKLDTAPSSLNRFFIERIRLNLRIAIIMNPALPTFYRRLLTCPGLLKCCAVYRFDAWPEDALRDLANNVLQEDVIFAKDTQLLKICVQFCQKIHITAISRTKRLDEKFGMRYNVTPEMYIKFLRMFQVLYRKKIEDISTNRNRYQQGLEKLNSTASQVTSMQAELQVLKPKLLDTSDSTEKLMVKIEQNTVKMEATKEIVAADEALANEAAAAAQAIRDDCESDLSEAEPALLSATNALNTLNSSDITVIKAMKNPPSIVKLVLESVCVMRGMKAECRTDVAGNMTEDFWPTCLKLLGDAKFLDNLKAYDKENINPQIMSTIRERFITHPDFEPEIVKKVSNACEGLCRWVRAMEIYDRVIKIVRPKKVKLANAEAAYASQMEKLNEKRTQLTEVMSKLQVLHDEWAEKTKQKKELEDAIEICALKLERAGKLLESLRYEKQRWQELENELNKNLIRSVGDIFLSAAFITYLTIFPPDVRKEILGDWYEKCQQMQLPVTKDYSFSSTFITPDDIKFWKMAGLPTDDVSVDSYTIIKQTTNLSFIIDPQGQAKQYILHLEKDNHLMTLKASDENLFGKIKEVLTVGESVPILIEEILDQPDEFFVFLMKPEFLIIDGTIFLKLIDENIACSQLPKIYVVTSQNNESYHQIYNYATLIDFKIIPEQLEYRLLKMIISVDAPDLESQHKDLLLKCAEDCQSLYQTEEKILNVLSSTDSNILEDETALQTLNDSKNLLEEIRVKQRKSSIAEENSKLAYAPFKEISNLASRIFFAVTKLHHLDSFYVFSFDWFINLFYQAVKKSEKSESLEKRISLVNVYFVKSLYNELEQILDEKYLLVAKFFISVQMAAQEGFDEKTSPEMDIFSSNLRVNGLFTSAKPHTLFRQRLFTKSYTTYAFNDYDYALLELRNLFNHFESKNAVPPTLSKNLGSNTFISALQEFVIQQFDGDNSSLDLYEVYHNSDDRIPIICSFTHFDIDPLNEILFLASEIGLPDDIINCVTFSKTQAQTTFSSIVSEALKGGKWIVVHDFHLLKKTFNNMVRLLNKISATSDVHSQFKFWIVTFPDQEIPITILYKSIKITMKGNKYLGPMLHQLYTYSSIRMPEMFENQKSNKRWNFHFFLVCFCHSILKTIQNYGKYFLDVSCKFTKMNFRSSCTFLEILSANDEYINFIEDFKYLLSECNYGANFSEVTDQFMLSTIIESLNVEQNDNPSFIKIINIPFTIPRDTSFNSCMRFIQSLPKTNFLEELNLHHFLTLEQMQTTVNFWKYIRKLYNCDVREEESSIQSLLDDILTALNTAQQFGDFCSSYKDIFNCYLRHEMDLYRKLTGNIKISSEHLRSSSIVNGEISRKLLKNKIPTSWSTLSYPFANSLKIYIWNLNKRLVVMNKWIHFGQPEVIWLPGLFNVLGFFTALKYNFCKHHKSMLSDIVLDIEVTQFDANSFDSEEWRTFHQERKNQNPFGVFVKGLILVGGTWNRERMTIDEDLTCDNYFDILPIVWIVPKLYQERETSEKHYACPLYYTHQIHDKHSDFRFANFITRIDLPVSGPLNKIAQRGVRLILYLD